MSPQLSESFFSIRITNVVASGGLCVIRGFVVNETDRLRAVWILWGSKRAEGCNVRCLCGSGYKHSGIRLLAHNRSSRRSCDDYLSVASTGSRGVCRRSGCFHTYHSDRNSAAELAWFDVGTHWRWFDCRRRALRIDSVLDKLPISFLATPLRYGVGGVCFSRES